MGPGTFPAPLILFLVGRTPAAERRRVAVGGVRREKWKERSGRTIMRAGIGVPAA
jgi:predicted Rossmann fold nucleotide-binding protein DprA/Smf involved in DNA uptake